MSNSKETPMIKQYLAIKDRYPDAILFYRMGDFYEMFFEDAQVASKVLEITLTSRNKKAPSPVPMCGVPYKAATGYIARLIENGYKVAVCDQIEDAALAEGLVKRDVVRVITPGTLIEDELLDEKSNNFILTITRNHKTTGLAFLDISTGTFQITESDDFEAIMDETLRISPSELLLPESFKNHKESAALIKMMAEKSISFFADRIFDATRGRERLIEQFQTISLEGFGCEKLSAGLGAAGALLYYVKETQKQKITHLNGIRNYTLDSYLWVDDLSCRNLELIKNARTDRKKGTLLGTLDNTVTAMGARRLKQWLRYPLTEPDQIEMRFEAVKEAKDRMSSRRELRLLLKDIYDLERLNSKICMGHANARDLISLKTSLNALPGLKNGLIGFDNKLLCWDSEYDVLNGLSELIESAIRDDSPPTILEGGLIKEGFEKKLDELILISRDGKSWLVNLEIEEKEKTGINSLKIRYNKVFGYYIEIPRARANEVPPNYIRKQTLVNSERYITDELKSFELKILGAEEQRAILEYEIFKQIKNEIIANSPLIKIIADFIARLDCLLNLAEIAQENNYIRPELNQKGVIQITQGRHPVIEKMIKGERFVPNNIDLDNSENQILIITGPNMAGKSTVLRQVALTVIMAQIGSFVPAQKASIAITDRIYTRVGALDNLAAGQSTFMVEMEETANILNNVTPQSLVIMDEIGRGTSTFDGLSIAWAVAEYLHDLKGQGVKALFATHYHELTELANFKHRVKNYNIAVKEWNDEIIFLRKLVPGGTNRSYGIQVARLAGLPAQVILCAKKILARIGQSPYGKGSTLLSGNEKKEIETQEPVQLDMFTAPEIMIIKKLKKIDIAKMTPLEAMNCLNDFKECLIKR